MEAEILKALDLAAQKKPRLRTLSLPTDDGR
jgi:hypothetical protein